VIVVLVKGAWAALQGLQVSWAESRVVPLVLCLLLGMALTVANLLEEKPKPTGWVIGLLVGLLNSLVTFGAVLGIPASNAGGPPPSTGG
jgi:hypothetical protein